MNCLWLSLSSEDCFLNYSFNDRDFKMWISIPMSATNE